MPPLVLLSPPLSCTLIPSFLFPSSLFFSLLYSIPTLFFLFSLITFSFHVLRCPTSTFLDSRPFPFYPIQPCRTLVTSSASATNPSSRPRLSRLNATTSSASGKASRHHSMSCRARCSSRVLVFPQPLPDSPTCYCRLESFLPDTRERRCFHC